jgi:hypothetical protein
MDILRKAAQAALDAYDQHDPLGVVMADLRAALAQPEPFNPDWDRVNALEESLREHMAEIQRLKALAQPERKPLTEEEIAEISMDCSFVSESDTYFARAIEAAHGIE